MNWLPLSAAADNGAANPHAFSIYSTESADIRFRASKETHMPDNFALPFLNFEPHLQSTRIDCG
jgi:hypothetical protein